MSQDGAKRNIDTQTYTERVVFLLLRWWQWKGVYSRLRIKSLKLILIKNFCTSLFFTSFLVSSSLVSMICKK